MRHAKTFADEMYDSEQALDRAAEGKQAIRAHMEKLGAHLFVGHGYEFARTPGEESFTARKVKRGSKPADTVASQPDAGGFEEIPASERGIGGGDQDDVDTVN